MGLSKDERIKKVEELKKFWTDLFTEKELGIEPGEDIYFYPKPLFVKNKCFNLFETELKGIFFTEIVDFDYNPVSPRKLFVTDFTKKSLSKYKKIDTRIGDQYEVPFSEFTEIIVKIEEEEILAKTYEDAHFTSDMSVRDYACIHLKIPKSNKKWLNELIKEAK